MKFHSAKDFLTNKKVLFFLFGTIFFMINISVSYSVVPVFLINQNFTIAQVGISTSVYSFSAIILRIFLGPLSDNHGRKLTLMVSASSFVISWILIWIAPSYELHLIARVIQAIGLALYMSTGSSVVSDIADKKILGTCLGIYRGFLGFGFLLGPVIGLKLIKISNSFLFIGIISIAIISLILLSFVFETGIITKEKQKTNLFNNYKELLGNHNLLRYYLLVLTLTCGFGIINTNAAIFLNSQVDVISPSIYLLSIAGMGMIASLIGGRLIDKFGIKKVIIPGVILALTGFIAMSFVEYFGNYALFISIFTLGLGTNSTVISSITGIQRATRIDLKATSFAIQESAYDGGFVIGNLIFGFLVIGVGFSYSFLIIGLIMGVSYLTILISDHQINKNH
ncbi:MAG: MFS transporter [Firmicutes bacterium]|nr:MFS transporter [Bacillota bacterium]